MRKQFQRLSLWSCILAGSISFQSFKAPVTCSLEVRIKGAENANGNMSLLLFNSKTGFPSDANRAIKYSVVKATGSLQTVVFDNLPPGTYAVAVMHDQNGNGVLDTNLLGIPQEGIGVSNDAINTFGPPEFDESSFQLKESRKTIDISMEYW
jgi:uncharacterized protein (DUF2141 family)